MMAGWSSLKDALVVAVTNWRLWLLQFFGNAAIFFAFLGWLRFPDARWWQLALQALLVTLIAIGIVVLHGGTLNYMESAHREKTARFLPAFTKALRHLLAIGVGALVLHFLQHLIGHLDAYQQTFPGYLRSEFPAWLRRLISQPALDSTYNLLISLLEWVVLPGLLLPFVLFAAGRGFRGLIAFGDWRRTVANVVYWISLAVAAVVGVYCTAKIMDWKLDPRTATLGAEEASLAFRLLFSYLLAIFAWMLVCSMLGRLRGGQSAAQPQ